MPDIIDKLAWIEIQDRKVLYARSVGKDLFYNPSGKRKEGESDLEALARELSEELCVDILPDTAEYQETFSAQAHDKPDGTFVAIACYTAQYRGTLCPAREVEEMAWFTSADYDRTTATGQLILTWLKKRDLID